jgi:hypothetical protein
MTWLPDNKCCRDFWFAENDGEFHLFYLPASKSQYNAEAHFSGIGQAIVSLWGWYGTTESFDYIGN